MSAVTTATLLRAALSAAGTGIEKWFRGFLLRRRARRMKDGTWTGEKPAETPK